MGYRDGTEKRPPLFTIEDLGADAGDSDDGGESDEEEGDDENTGAVDPGAGTTSELDRPVGGSSAAPGPGGDGRQGMPTGSDGAGTSKVPGGQVTQSAPEDHTKLSTDDPVTSPGKVAV